MTNLVLLNSSQLFNFLYKGSNLLAVSAPHYPYVFFKYYLKPITDFLTWTVLFKTIDPGSIFIKNFFWYVRLNRLSRWRRIKKTQIRVKNITRFFKVQLPINFNTVYTASHRLKINPIPTHYTMSASSAPLDRHIVNSKGILNSKKYLNSFKALPLGLGSFETYSLFLTSYIREFITAITQFLKFNLNRLVIRYNTLNTVGIYYKIFMNNFYYKNPVKDRISSFITYNKYNYNFHPIRDSNFMQYASIKKLTSRSVINRIRTFWVSKITQLTLVPARNEFEITHRKPIRYQYRITRLILKYYRHKVLEFVNAIEFSLISVLLKSGFISYKPFGELLIRSCYVFINSLPVVIPRTLLYYFDTLQLPLNFKFINFLNWSGKLFYIERRRFFWYLKKWRIRSDRPYPKKSSFRIPNWIRRQVMFSESVPDYLEIDFTCLTSLVLYNASTDYTSYNFLSFYLNSPATIRPLNWKSLS